MLWNAAADTYNYVFSNLSKVQPDCIKSLTVDLADGRTVEVDSDELTANYIGTGSHIYELSLTEADETYLVTFWAQQGNDLHWTRYSVVAVEKGGTVGNKMPADPDTGNYVFIGWELSSHDGSGSKFTADIVVNSDIDVYARKVSVGGGSAYHVMNPDTELNAYAADKLGAASAEAVTIDSVRVNGQDEEATNPSYTTNGWKAYAGVSYFYIYNEDAYAASFDPQYNNTRVPASEVTSITLFCTLNGEEKEVNIGIDELELAVVSDVIVEIRLHKSGDGDFIITASAGENGSISPVGKVSVAAGADQSFSFLPGDGFTVDTLTVNNTTTYENDGSGSFDLTGYTFRNVQANGSIRVTFAADANDNDIPDYKETKYGVTYEFVSGTDGKVLPGSDMPALPSDNSEYLIGITVINKGESTYEAVSVDDGTWTFTGWDANEKVMSKDGITFTGYWTFTPNEPEPGTYTIEVEVINGTAEFMGTNIGAYNKIVAAADEDITITFTPDEGYTLDYATIDGKMLPIPPDGVYTLKQVDSNHTIKVVYAEDKLGDGEDGNKPDGTPDYRQVFVKYVAGDGNGVVNPSFDTFNLEVDENGKVKTVPLSLSGEATPNADATFAYWTIEGLGYDGGAYSYEADLSGKGFTGYVAGQTYTFTAHFNGPVVKPEQPDVYNIYVTVHNGTATFSGREVTSHILAAENEDITITFTPYEGYTLDYATIDGKMLLIPPDGVYTLKLVDSNHTIEVFYAEDKLGGGDDGNEPDGTPDYRQVFVKYVAADGNGSVAPSFNTFDLEVDENGKVMANVALSLEGVATPNADATFAYWTIDGLGFDGGAYSYEADLSGKGFTGYVAGQTYTFTAHFNGPVVKPEEPKVFDIYVTVHNGTATFYGSKVTSSIRAAEGEDITITFTPDEGYTLDYATIDDGTLLIPPTASTRSSWLTATTPSRSFTKAIRLAPKIPTRATASPTSIRRP